MNNEQIEFIWEDEDGLEHTESLPARYEVCGRCEGHGTHLTPSIGEHAYTREEFEESFDEEEQEEYMRRGGIYDVQCEECKGLRVVLVVDEEACDAKLLKLYHDHQQQEADARAEDRYWRRVEGGW